MRNLFVILFVIFPLFINAQSYMKDQMKIRLDKLTPQLKASNEVQASWVKANFKGVAEELKAFIDEGYVNEGIVASSGYGLLSQGLEGYDLAKMSRQEFGAVAETICMVRMIMDGVRSKKLVLKNNIFVEKK